MTETCSRTCEMTEVISDLFASPYEASVCLQMLEKRKLVIETRQRKSVKNVKSFCARRTIIPASSSFKIITFLILKKMEKKNLDEKQGTKLTHVRTIHVCVIEIKIIVIFVSSRSFKDTKSIPLQLYFYSICQHLKTRTAYSIKYAPEEGI